MSESALQRPRVLIEDWLPVAELGIESRRERGAASALPPLSFLHVWWARRPLVASAAVVLAGLLPTWTEELSRAFPEVSQLNTEDAYHQWLFRLIGIWGDPVAAQRLADAAKVSGIKAVTNPFTYKQAFRNAIPRDDVELLHQVLQHTWGAMPLVLDPTAGGGSIPFTSLRLGLPTVANDLNGVAAAVLSAGLAIPAEYGTALTQELKHWGAVLVERVEARLKHFFPSEDGEQVTNYLWVNAVNCPRTGRCVPLLPDMWLRKDKGKEAAVRLVLDRADGELTLPTFEVLTGNAVDPEEASNGTLVRGKAISPYDNLVIDSGYIKAEASAGRMTQLLYAVIVRLPSGKREFRAPSIRHLGAIEAAVVEYRDRRQAWIDDAILPTEDFPDGNDMRPRNFGMTHWADFFTPRQALVHGTFAAEFCQLIPEVRAERGAAAEAILIELALMQGKALNYNSRLSSWHVSKQVTRSVFDRHDFAFKWTFSEFEGATALYAWCLDQLVDSYSGIASLLESTAAPVLGASSRLPRSVTVTQGSASQLTDVKDRSIAHICMDPPYYDNVMYAELADYFYVWEKRTLGRLLPQFFRESLTDKENEAVANPARFQAMGKRRDELADLDYEAKMTGIFAECRRVLRDDGVMSVMFTHKRSEAWDTLGMGLLQAGFTVETSWPVNTESEHSLHQANMNSAASTIMLVCRKRDAELSPKVFLDDIEADVRAAARDSAERFRAFGIGGVDLLLSTYGPVLSVISSHWPVYSTEAGADGKSRLLRPEEALSLAREEVVRLTRQRIVGQDVQIDNHSDFVLIAWETFKAFEFSFDEARRLALSVGALDIDELAQAKVVDKKSGTVRLLRPHERLRRSGDDSVTGVRVDATKFTYMNDALDSVLYVASVDGMSHAKALMDRLGLTGDKRFLAYVQGMVNAVPRVKLKGEWIVPEAGLLDTLVTAYLPDIVLPPEPEQVVVVEAAATLFDEM